MQSGVLIRRHLDTETHQGRWGTEGRPHEDAVRKKVATCKLRREASEEPKPADTLI